MSKIDVVTHSVRIVAKGNLATVEIDGVDVSNWCTGYTFATHGVRKPPTVSITLIPDELIFDADGADVATVRALFGSAAAGPPS